MGCYQDQWCLQSDAGNIILKTQLNLRTCQTTVLNLYRKFISITLFKRISINCIAAALTNYNVDQMPNVINRIKRGNKHKKHTKKNII